MPPVTPPSGGGSTGGSSGLCRHADPDTAKAAQWCVEQGLMKRRLNGKFAPGSSIPAYQVLNAYRKLAG